jgi:hypothetical protein
MVDQASTHSLDVFAVETLEQEECGRVMELMMLGANDVRFLHVTDCSNLLYGFHTIISSRLAGSG